MPSKANYVKSTLLETVSEMARLEEGKDGVRNILREVFRSPRISTKKLAYMTQLPIPVTAAVRRELENAGLLTRKEGAILTEKGEEFVRKQLGIAHTQRLTCPTCKGRSIHIPEEFSPLLKKLEKHLATRPRALSWLDQAHGTPQTALRRALIMLERGDVDGRRIIFLGDDDLTSIAVGSLRTAKAITVADVDERILETIRLVSQEENLQIDCVEHDLRKPLPKHLQSRHDVVFTDPPYTTAGLTLFLSRGIEALQRQQGSTVYLSYAHQSPKKMLRTQKALLNMGLAITEHIPRFNTYKGAEMFANTTFLIRLKTTERTRPLIKDAFDDKLYTGEVKQTRRLYICQCGKETRIGATENIRTIEELKAKGCPECGKRKGFKLKEKQRIGEDITERLTLRDFEWRDFPAILQFEREIARKSFPENPKLDEEYHRFKLEQAVKRRSNTLKVALMNQEIVGWLWLRTEKDRNTDEKFGYLKTVIVKPEHRHREIGRKLIEATRRHFLNKGIRRIDLIVSAANYGATQFFEEAGFSTQHSTMRMRLRNDRKARS